MKTLKVAAVVAAVAAVGGILARRLGHTVPAVGETSRIRVEAW